MIFGGELYRDDLNKISFILNSYEDYLTAAKDFPDMKVGTWGGAGEIKAAADFVTDTVDNDGLKKAFIKLKLI